MTHNPDGEGRGDWKRKGGGGENGRVRDRWRERKMGSDGEAESEMERREETTEDRKQRETLHCSLNELHLAATRHYFMIPHVHTCVAVWVCVCAVHNFVCDCSVKRKSERFKENNGRMESSWVEEVGNLGTLRNLYLLNIWLSLSPLIWASYQALKQPQTWGRGEEELQEGARNKKTTVRGFGPV